MLNVNLKGDVTHVEFLGTLAALLETSIEIRTLSESVEVDEATVQTADILLDGVVENLGVIQENLKC